MGRPNTGAARADAPIRVLMVGPLPPPVGGMATIVGNLADAFEAMPGVELRLLNNVKTTAAGRRLWQGIAAQLQLLRRLAWTCMAWRPGVVHIHTCSWLTFWRNAVDVLLARLLLRPVVLHIHGAQFHHFLGGLPRPKAWVARRIFGAASRIVVLGDGWKRLLDDWADPDKVVVVPNGVPVQPPVELPAESDPQTPFRVICLANYEVRKGQADLLRAVAALERPRPVTVALLGFEAGPGERGRLLELARDLGIADRVEIPGPVTGPDKEQRLRAAHCFCLPSYDEGLPMSMLEAMAAGLPVVATRVGAIPEAVSDGADGLLYAPGDIAALVARLETLVDMPRRAIEIGRAGRERLIASFSLEQSAALLADAYRTLA